MKSYRYALFGTDSAQLKYVVNSTLAHLIRYNSLQIRLNKIVEDIEFSLNLFQLY